jgi:hypothetical protein
MIDWQLGQLPSDLGITLALHIGQVVMDAKVFCGNSFGAVGWFVNSPSPGRVST